MLTPKAFLKLVELERSDTPLVSNVLHSISPALTPMNGNKTNRNLIDEQGLTFVLANPFAVFDETNNFHYKTISDNQIYDIIKSGNFSSLKVLHLRDNQFITNHGLQILFASSAAAEIRELSLVNCLNVDDDSIKFLSESKYLTNLQKLDLTHCLGLTNQSMNYLSKSSNLNNLKYLNISSCYDIDDMGIQMIAYSNNFQNLTKLKLNKLYLLTKDGIEKIAYSDRLKSLVSLSLQQNQSVDNDCLRMLISSPLMKRLECLNLNYCSHITYDAIVDLINSPSSSNLKTLKIIEIKSSRLIDTALARSQFLTKLEKLHVSNQLEFDEYLKSSNARNLTSLTFYDNTMDEPTYAKMKKYQRHGIISSKLLLTNSLNIDKLTEGDALEKVQALIVANMEEEEVYKKVFASQKEEKDSKVASLYTTSLTDLNQYDNNSWLGNLEVLQLCGAPNLTIEAQLALNIAFQIRSFENLKVLRFHNFYIDDKTLLYLARSNIAGLKTLIFDNTPSVTSSGIRYIVTSPVCMGLQKLTIKDFELTLDAYKYIASSEDLEKLEKLQLKNVNITAAAIAEILKSKKLVALKSLSLKGNSTMDDLCATMIANYASRLQNLTTLRVDLNNEITLKGWSMLKDVRSLELNMKKVVYDQKFIEKNPEFKEREAINKWRTTLDCMTNNYQNVPIESLVIRGSSYLNEKAAAEILSQNQLAVIDSIELHNFESTDEIFKTLTESKFVRTLDVIALSNCVFQDEMPFLELFLKNAKNLTKVVFNGCEGFKDHHINIVLNTLSKLKVIELRRLMDITDDAMRNIANAENTRNIKRLIIDDCDTITDNGIIALTESSKLQRLTHIEIQECDGIATESIKRILCCSNMPNLHYFHCNKPEIVCTESFIQAFLSTKLKKLFQLKLEIKTLHKMNIHHIMNAPPGYLKRQLVSRVFHEDNLKLIDDDYFSKLLKGGEINFCSKLPELLPNAANISTSSVLLLLSKSREPEFELNVLRFLENWNYLIEDEVILKMCEDPRLKKYLINYDFLKLPQIRKEGLKKFISTLESEIELLDFINCNKNMIDDDLFDAITKHPSFIKIRDLKFSELKKLTARGIQKIFSSGNSSITFSKFLESYSSSKEYIEADIVAAAFKSSNFDAKIFNPTEFKNLTSAYIEDFFKSTHLSCIKELHLSANWITRESMGYLSSPESYQLSNLEIIRFTNPFTKKFEKYIAYYVDSPNFQKIKQLYISECELGSEFFQYFAKSPYKSSLELLSFNKVRSDDGEAFDYFSTARSLVSLKNITILNFTPIKSTMLRNLSWANFNVKSLKFGAIDLPNIYEICRFLATTEHYNTLEHLELFHLNLDDQFLQDLAQSQTLCNLKSIGLKRIPNFTINGFKEYIRSYNVSKLESLTLILSQMDNTWLKEIAESPRLKLLKNINVHCFYRRRDTEKDLTPGLTDIILSSKLESLDLATFLQNEARHVSDDLIVNAVCKSQRLERVTNLNLESCNITSQSILALLSKINLNIFDLKAFLENHKMCKFIDDNVYVKLTEGSQFKSKIMDIDFNSYSGITIKGRLREMLKKSEFTQAMLDNFLQKNADKIDDDVIHILIDFEQENKSDKEHIDNKKEKRILIKLNPNLHKNITKNAINRLVVNLANPFTLEYDWIFIEEAWRKLLNVDSLKIISEALNDALDYVDNLDFSTNNFLTSNGYQHLMKQHIRAFIDENNLKNNDPYLEDDSEAFLKGLAQKRFDKSRITSDDQCGEYILRIISKADFIRKINLKNKNFGDKFLKKLSIIISKRSVEGSYFLEEIILSNNPRITSVGRKYLYAALVGNNTIRSVDISCEADLEADLNVFLNYGMHIAIKEKFKEYYQQFKARGLAIYDKVCIPITLYSFICMPFACLQIWEDKISERIAKSRCLKAIADGIAKCSASLTGKRRTQQEIENEKKGKREKFIFTKNMIKLNYILGSSWIRLIFFINFLLFYAVSMLIPIYFIDNCQDGHSITGYYIYAGYAVFIFLFETFLYYTAAKVINDKNLVSFSWVDLIPLATSQNAKFDFFSDMLFVTKSFVCENKKIGIAAAIIIGVNLVFNLYVILGLFLRPIYSTLCRKKKREPHNTKYINKCSKLSFALELHAVGHLLDRFSTSSASKWGEQYYPQVMITAFSKFILEDFPQSIILFINIAMTEDTTRTITIISLISTGLSLLLSFNGALRARPSKCTPGMIRKLALNIEERSKDFHEIQEIYETRKTEMPSRIATKSDYRIIPISPKLV